MKIIVSCMSIILFLTVSCKEDEQTGICTACCDADGFTICQGNFTKKMCADYNKRKVDGYEWTFEERDICPPKGPL